MINYRRVNEEHFMMQQESASYAKDFTRLLLHKVRDNGLSETSFDVQSNFKR